MATVILTLLVLSPAIVAARSVTSGKLLELSSEQELYGKYASGDGTHGIIFKSTADGHLLIENLAGESIVKTGPFYEADGKKVRSVFIKNHEYLQHDSPARQSRHAIVSCSTKNTQYERNQPLNRSSKSCRAERTNWQQHSCCNAFLHVCRQGYSTSH